MTAEIVSIAPARPPARHSFEQIIIAGGDEDVSSCDMLDWISPLLAGVPQGRWASCQLDHGPDGEILARYRHGGSEEVWSFAIDGRLEETRRVLAQLPGAQSLTMILMSEFISQAVTLLDGIAGWLSIHDLGAAELAPLARLFEHCETERAAA